MKVAIIGVGKRALDHIKTLRKLDEIFEIVALCDVDHSRLAISKRLGTKAFTSVKEMLINTKPELALIAVQAEGHHVITKVLAEEGIHVLCETPIAISLRCAREMISISEKCGILLEVSENVPRWPRERLKREVIKEGILGKLREFYLSYVSGSYHGMAAIRHLIGTNAVYVEGEFPRLNSTFERGYIKFPDLEGIYELNVERGNYWEIRGEKGTIGKMKVQVDDEVYPIRLEVAEKEDMP